MPPTALLAGVSEHSALPTDLYPLTMLRGYRDRAQDEIASPLPALASAVYTRQRETDP